MQAGDQQNFIFSDEAIKNFAGLYNALKKVHDRLIREGYKIENGEIIKPSANRPS